MRNIYTATIALTLSLIYMCASAQANRVNVHTTPTLESNSITAIVVSDSATRDALVGATIRIISGKDTTSASAAPSKQYGMIFALYESQKRFRQPVELSVNCLGYKRFSKTYKANDFTGQINIFLAEDPKSIASIEVIGNRVAMIVRGDTTIYNAEAFKTLAADKLSELLKQLPGIVVTDNGIFADGAPIKRVYIDGRNFFGDNTAIALTDMTAQDVKSVKVYDQQSATAKRIGDKGAPKEKVMDVVTHSKPSVIRNIMIDLSAGASTNREYNGEFTPRTAQYGLVGINKTTQNYRLTAYRLTNGFVSQVTNYNQHPTATPGHNIDINGSYSYRPNDSLTVGVSAAYSNIKSKTESRSSTNYFPTELYKLRQIENLNSTLNRAHKYSVNSNVDLGRKRYRLIGLIRLTYEKLSADNSMSMTNRTDNTTLFARQSITNSTDSYAGSANVQYSQGIGKTLYLSTTADIDIGSNSRSGWRVDTLGSTSLRTLLNSNSSGRSIATKVNARLTKRVSKSSAIDMTYTFDYAKQSSRQIALDYLDNPSGAMDTVNTYDYTIDRTQNNLLAEYSYSNRAHSFRIGAIGTITSMSRDEKLPQLYYQPYTFYSLTPEFSYRYKNSVFASINSKTEEISVEQLRNVVDNSNPLFLRAGNPNLKQPLTTKAILSFNETVPARALTIGLSIVGQYTSNYIASKTLYFTEPTHLPEYNYDAPTGSSLLTVVNAGSSYSLKSTVSADKRLGAISSTLKTSIAYNYAVIPFFLEQQARTTAQHEMNVKINLSAGFSRHIKPEINSLTRAGIIVSGPYGRSRYIDQQLSGVIKTNFAKRYIFNTMATYALYRNDKAPLSARNDIYWNIEGGRTFGKKNRVRVMVGVIDLLNRTSNSAVVVRDDYVNSLTTSSLGRYWFVNISITF